MLGSIFAIALAMPRGFNATLFLGGLLYLAVFFFGYFGHETNKRRTSKERRKKVNREGVWWQF